MININLIRWRSSQRQHHFAQFVVNVCAAILLALCLVWSLYTWSQTEVMKQTAILQHDILSLNKTRVPATKEKISIASLGIYQQQYMQIKKILLSHYQASELLAALDELLPQQIVLTELHLKDDQLWLKGISHSNNSLTDFLDELGQFGLFKQPKISFSLQKNPPSLQSDRNSKHVSFDDEISKYFEIYVLLNNKLEV